MLLVKLQSMSDFLSVNLSQRSLHSLSISKATSSNACFHLYTSPLFDRRNSSYPDTIKQTVLLFLPLLINKADPRRCSSKHGKPTNSSRYKFLCQIYAPLIAGVADESNRVRNVATLSDSASTVIAAILSLCLCRPVTRSLALSPTKATGSMILLPSPLSDPYSYVAL